MCIVFGVDVYGFVCIQLINYMQSSHVIGFIMKSFSVE